MVGIFIDTNIWIDILRQMGTGGKDSIYLDFILEHHQQIYVSNVVISELWAGRSMSNTRAIEEVGKVINECKIIYPTLEDSILAGEYLRSRSIKRAFADAYIAAAVVNNNLKLLTLNPKDFEGIEGLEFVDIESE